MHAGWSLSGPGCSELNKLFIALASYPSRNGRHSSCAEPRSTVTGAPQGPPGQQSWLPRWALWILGLCPHGWQQSTLPCRQPARTGDVGLATGSGLTPSTPLGCAFAPRLKALNFQLGKGAQHLSAFSARHGSLANRHCPTWAEGCDGARHWLWQSSRCFCCSPLVPQDRAGSAAGAHCSPVVPEGSSIPHVRPTECPQAGTASPLCSAGAFLSSGITGTESTGRLPDPFCSASFRSNR